MGLAPMRFKAYTWPHNPETYSVSYERRMAAQNAPFGKWVMQELGAGYRVMRGEGVFTGPDAYQEFRKLAAVFAQEGPGLLVHPVWQAARAYFVTLELTEEPLPDYVRYRFAFWEDGGTVAAAAAAVSTGTGREERAADETEAAVWYTVKREDTLWAIAGRYDVSLRRLIELNPQIKNPNLIYAGNQVRVQ